ncbi:MAG TPA: transposase [Opitutus sp.]|nr:transposase [Opitutus sp.]
MTYLHTIRFTRDKLPHWEVESGRYFVTVRVSDSLPRDAILRLEEIHRTLSTILPQSSAFVALQRQYFRTMEKYLDAGAGSCLLRLAPIASLVVEELALLRDWKIEVPHYTVMPNHWHALIVPSQDCTHSLSAIMKRLKGRSAKRINRALNRSGPVWQREWFDRWMRNDAEWDKTVAYIRNNPVSAGLVSSWHEHSWSQ